jgi:hypothetical protein
MRIDFRLLLATVLVTLLAAGCPGGKGLPGGGSIPGGGNVPGGLGGSSGMVDPNTCGNYAASEAGRRFKNFLQALMDMQAATEETVKVVKQSCVMIGTEIGMIPADLEGETKEVCAKVYGTIDENMKVAFKSQVHAGRLPGQRRGGGEGRGRVRGQGLRRRQGVVLGHLPRQVQRHVRGQGRYRWERR